MTDKDNSKAQLYARTGRLKRGVCLAAGSLLFVIGLIGTLLPVLPTTVFWIGAAACFARSSPRLYQKVIGWGRTGEAIEAFSNHGVISPTGKIMAGTGMVLAGIIMQLTPMSGLLMASGFAILAIGAIYVFTRPSAPALALARPVPEEGTEPEDADRAA